MDTSLPRTPAVFPPKTSWALPEQASIADGHLPCDAFRGSEMGNYPSARLHAQDLAVALREQVAKGYMLELPEEEARARYGSRVAVAALGAIIKAERDDGSRSCVSSTMAATVST